MSTKKVTICECGLAQWCHEGSNPLAYRPALVSGSIPCKGYKPRPENWRKIEAARKGAPADDARLERLLEKDTVLLTNCAACEGDGVVEPELEVCPYCHGIGEAYVF